MYSDKIISEVIGIEGGYVNDASDSGGATRWGITKRTARRYGYTGKMRYLPREVAIDIYRRGYWDKIRGDDILHYAGSNVAAEVFEQAVNMGVTRASRNLQRILNVLNNRGKLYRDLRVDGQIGNATIVALKAYTAKRVRRGVKVLWKLLNSLQGAFYVELAENREKDEKFMYGWAANRVG